MHAPGALGLNVKLGVGRLGVAGTTVSHKRSSSWVDVVVPLLREAPIYDSLREHTLRGDGYSSSKRRKNEWSREGHWQFQSPIVARSVAIRSGLGNALRRRPMCNGSRPCTRSDERRSSRRRTEIIVRKNGGRR